MARAKMKVEVTMRHLFAVALMAPALAWSQQAPALNARELFYTPPTAGTAVKNDTPQSQAASAADKGAQKSAEKKVASKRASVPVTASRKQTDKSSPEKPAVVANGPLGLRYSVLKRNGAPFQEVDPDSTFHSGDRIRLVAQANTPGYLYVVMKGSSGNWSLLFPAAGVAQGDNLVKPMTPYTIPSNGAGQFVFDEQPGVEKLFLVLSRKPEADLEKLIYAVGQTGGDAPGAPAGGGAAGGRSLMASASIGDDVVSHLRQQMSARDLIFEKVDGKTPTADSSSSAKSGDGQVRIENAAYVVNPSTAPDARLVVDVSLKHQ